MNKKILEEANSGVGGEEEVYEDDEEVVDDEEEVYEDDEDVPEEEELFRENPSKAIWLMLKEIRNGI